MTPQKLVIIGAGSFGREVLDVVEAVNLDYATTGIVPFDVLGFVDDGEPDPETIKPYGVTVLGPVSALDDLPSDVGFLVGVGAPAVRRTIVERFPGRPSPILVHPSATLGRAVELGAGTVVCAGVRLTNNIHIGRHVHLNINATIGHDARLADYVTVSPLVAISGNVTVEDSVLIGTGVSVNPGLTVHRGATVGTGAAVVKDVSGRSTVVGVPAAPR